METTRHGGGGTGWGVLRCRVGYKKCFCPLYPTRAPPSSTLCTTSTIVVCGLCITVYNVPTCNQVSTDNAVMRHPSPGVLNCPTILEFDLKISSRDSDIYILLNIPLLILYYLSL